MSHARTASRPESRHQKGEQSRRRILDAALKAFGEQGYKGATTRRITEDAGANLPALKYYFGSKEELYLACAREIVTRYADHMLDLVSKAVVDLSSGLTPPEARARLKAILASLVEIAAGDEGPGLWMAFAQREMASPGPAFDILYEQLWRPGIELTAGLVSRALDEQTVSVNARLQALTLLSGLTAFSSSRSVTLKYLKWKDVQGDERIALFRRSLDQQIDWIGAL